MRVSFVLQAAVLLLCVIHCDSTVVTGDGAGGVPGGGGSSAGAGASDGGGSDGGAPSTWVDEPECFEDSECPQLCAAYRCVAGFDCDPANVSCDAPPPQCERGETPSIEYGCWGPCVRATECAYITSCDLCGAFETCIVYEESRHCVETPEECRSLDQGNAKCGCMGNSICPNDGVDGVMCDALDPGEYAVGCQCNDFLYDCPQGDGGAGGAGGAGGSGG